MLDQHYRLLAGFNAWANGRLYKAVADLPEAEYHKARSCAFFASIHGTLNHLLVVDRLWFGRVEGVVADISSLDQTLYDDFAALRAAREAEDARIIALVEGFDDAGLAQERRFRMITAPEEQALPVHLMLATVFNHQTHHRGQVHAMLSETAVAPPPLDIIYFAREAG
jgi:uncharacterized damage-inducible protein DinB